MYKGANDNCEIHKKQPTAGETLLFKGREQDTFSELCMLRSEHEYSDTMVPVYAIARFFSSFY